MLIIADANIPFAEEAFSQLGEVQTVIGRKVTRAVIKDAEVLLVRSVTRVDADLLEGTRVRFVATATIGTDHVDTAYLKSRGIGFASAPGSNANSVAEYVVAALLEVAGRLGWTLEGRSIGVVGVGNVGSQVVEKCRALGMVVLENDPPLLKQTGDERYRSLEELLACHLITLHVPLDRSGPHPTYHLADDEFFSRLRPGAVFLNTSRGAVHETDALLQTMRRGRLSAAVLDVWEGEPDISTELLEATTLGTPHIAGYSFDGKVRGTEMIYRAASKFLGVAPTWTPELPAPPHPELRVDARGREEEDVLREVVTQVYPIGADDAMLRKIRDLEPKNRPKYFDSLRKDYPVRREFPNTTVKVIGGSEGLLRKLQGIGFRTGENR